MNEVGKNILPGKKIKKHLKSGYMVFMELMLGLCVFVIAFTLIHLHNNSSLHPGLFKNPAVNSVRVTPATN